MRTVGECREIAEAYRQLAMRLTNPDDKRAVEMMTAAWTRLANEREAALRNKAILVPVADEAQRRAVAYFALQIRTKKSEDIDLRLNEDSKELLSDSKELLTRIYENLR
jgi:hypothetical protein